MARTILLTGASGYVGGLIAAALLTNEDVQILAPVRMFPASERFFAPIEAEVRLAGHVFDDAMAARIRLVELPPLDRLSDLDAFVEHQEVDEIVHSAGCLDYFNAGALQEVNIGYTTAIVELAERWKVSRLTYISTAFSSGYVRDRIAESIHGQPGKDPTDYTRTKRDAESIVASSGVPFLILRPAIIIGSSRDGHYSGKQYGLYQLWNGIERLLCREWHPEIHLLAPRQPVQLVHQDAFQSAFLASRRLLPPGSIVNVVSSERTLPDLRALWNLWLGRCLRPREIFYYQSMADIPIRDINGKQRALLALASVNLQIASHPWCYETTNLDSLRASGMEFADATLDSVAVCQELFLTESKAIQEFLINHGHCFAEQMNEIEIPMGGVALAREVAAATA
ncbi:MAG: SDR family oxidoreductase [Thermoanaerobaculia bacterium]